jgi:hypothetical protein
VLFKVFGFGARELRGKGLKECFLDMLWCSCGHPGVNGFAKQRDGTEYEAWRLPMIKF